MRRLFTCSIQLVYAEGEHEVVVSSFIAERADFWWSVREPDAPVLWDSTIELGEKFFQEIIAHPVPLDMHILKALKRSPLGLDLYFWLVYRTFVIKTPLTITWRQLYRQFGVEAAQAENRNTVNRFRSACLRELKKNQTRMARLELPHGDGRARHRAVATAYPAGTTPSHHRIGPSGARG